jgi:hypothetical protein
MRITLQGKVITNIACKRERELYAERNGKSLEEVPIKYGSARISINKVRIDSKGEEVYWVNKISESPDIREVRLLLEISYRFDSALNIVPEHDVMEMLEVGQSYDLILSELNVSPKHHKKLLVLPGRKPILTYFVKTWADCIEFVDLPTLQAGSHSLSPSLISQYSSNFSLVS